jgi:hypothetical protein
LFFVGGSYLKFFLKKKGIKEEEGVREGTD